MYSPEHYKENGLDRIYEIIQQYSLATLITSSGHKCTLSHLPFVLLDRESNQPRLISHMAKANPQWQEFSAATDIQILFNGPSAYISPAWYVPKARNVPTWNYAVVHVSGTIRLMTDRREVVSSMSALVRFFETKNETDWKFEDSANSEVDSLLNHIVVFEVKDLKFDAKFKLSQKQDRVDRNNVIHELRRKPLLGARETADWMSRVGETGDS